VCQLAKARGIKVVGIAGGAEKGNALKRDLGVDAVVDYRVAKDDVEKLSQLIKEAAPQGIDGYFDNVGGPITEAIELNLNQSARVYMCGAVSQYTKSKGFNGIHTVEPKDIYTQKNIIHTWAEKSEYTFVVPQARAELYKLIEEGKLKPIEWVVEGGINKSVQAFIDLYNGKNYGKTVVKF
jgi:NADPH-dependent curcumin reductase CurA